MIGTLINKFEELEEQTVETFNKTFPHCPLRDYAPNLKVEIGEIANTTRKITIDDNESFYHEMRVQEDGEFMELAANCKAIKLYNNDNTLIGEFKAMGKAASYLNITLAVFNHRIRSNKYIVEEL